MKRHLTQKEAPPGELPCDDVLRLICVYLYREESEGPQRVYYPRLLCNLLRLTETCHTLALSLWRLYGGMIAEMRDNICSTFECNGILMQRRCDFCPERPCAQCGHQCSEGVRCGTCVWMAINDSITRTCLCGYAPCRDCFKTDVVRCWGCEYFFCHDCICECRQCGKSALCDRCMEYRRSNGEHTKCWRCRRPLYRNKEVTSVYPLNKPIVIYRVGLLASEEGGGESTPGGISSSSSISFIGCTAM
jgi:hypothetical protein